MRAARAHPLCFHPQVATQRDGRQPLWGTISAVRWIALFNFYLRVANSACHINTTICRPACPFARLSTSRFKNVLPSRNRQYRSRCLGV